MSSRQQQRQRARRQQARQRAQGTAQRSAGPRGSGPKGPSRTGSSGLGRGPIWAGIAAFVVVVAAFGYAAAHGLGSSSTPTPQATTASQSATPAVDGIQCGTLEQLAYHIHQHLALYENGKQVQVPSEIGIPGGENNPTCFYWIHVHASTPDIIHVESPIHKTFNLGNFFDIWTTTKSSANPPGNTYVLRLQAAAARGRVHAFLNGKPWHGSYRSIPLKEHAVITVEIGTPVVPPKPFTTWNGL